MLSLLITMDDRRLPLIWLDLRWLKLTSPSGLPLRTALLASGDGDSTTSS